MTEKRFELIELYGDDHLIDNETNEKIGYDLHSPSTFNANWNNVCNLLNELHEENQELRMDNDIKFWKHQFMSQYNENQVILHELSLAINKGYEISDKFKKWIDDSAERNKEVMEKNERLFE